MPGKLVSVTFLAVVLATWPATVPTSVAAAAGPSQATPQSLSNADIIRMVQHKLSDGIIIASIRQAKRPGFDLSPDGLIALKKAGVTDNVIAEMMQAGSVAERVDTPSPKPSSERARDTSSTDAPSGAGNNVPSREAGIYVSIGGEVIPLEPTTFSQGKTGGMFTSALTYGIKKAKWKAIIRGRAANQRLDTASPVFYFHFEQKGSGLSHSGGFGGWLAGASSPNEFVLAKMTIKERDRELIVGEFGVFGSSTGTRSKDTTDLEVVRVRPGVYRVRPAQALAPGEYCFFYAAGLSTFGAGTAGKLFDFGVQPTGEKAR